MTILNKKLLISGEHNRRHEITKQVLKLDAGQLKKYTKMITARSWATAAGYHRMLIITGGVNSKNKILNYLRVAMDYGIFVMIYCNHTTD